MDTQTKKESAIGFFVVLFAILSWYFLRRLFRLEEVQTFDYLITIIFFIIFLGIYGLLCFLAEKWKVIMVVSLFSALSFFLSFHFDWLNLVAALLFFVALAANFGKIKDEKSQRVSLSVFRSLRHGFFWSLIVLFAFTSLSYYLILQEKGEKEVQIKLPPIAIKSTSNYLLTFLSASLFPGVSFGAETTVDDLIKDSLKTQFENPAYNVLSEEEKKKLTEENLPESRKELSETVGFELSGNEKMTEVILRASNKKINQIVAPYRSYVPLILALSLFITLLAISPAIKWLSILIAFILFRILLAIKFLKIEKAVKEVEIINF